jgi:hypothetical protein
MTLLFIISYSKKYDVRRLILVVHSIQSIVNS